MEIHRRRLCVVALFLAPFVLEAQNRDYLPLSANEVGPPFPLKKVGVLTQGSAPLPSRAGPSGSTYQVLPDGDGGSLELSGADKGGNPWQADIFTLWGCAGGAHTYETDLDADGIQDAVLLMPTCGNGLAPDVHLVTVTFDGAGRPVAFEAEGYFEEKARGIDSLVDLDRDGKADLIFMNFNDGYWITHVYSMQSARWIRVQGAFAGRTFPLYTRFTNRSNTRAVIPPSSRHPWAPDLSTARPVLAGIIVGWKWPDSASPPSDLQLMIQADGKETVCSPVYWYDSARVVLDKAGGRTLKRLSIGAREMLDEVLRELVLQKVPVRLYGRRNADHCSPELVWAEPQ